MGRIRRRRTKYTWMPTLGGESAGGDNKYGVSYFGDTVTADWAGLGPTDLYVTPLVPDITLFPDGASGAEVNDQPTLRDFTEGQDWLLKRIVGRIFVAPEFISATDATTPPWVMVGAGFFVMRARDDMQNIPDATNKEIDPLGSENIRQPWLWRRTWLLRVNGVTSTGGNPTYDGPTFNYLGSVAEGSTIDSKVARRIRREERLFFALNCYGGRGPDVDAGAQGTGEGFTTPANVAFNLDYRILGAMRRSNNRSVF